MCKYSYPCCRFYKNFDKKKMQYFLNKLNGKDWSIFSSSQIDFIGKKWDKKADEFLMKLLEIYPEELNGCTFTFYITSSGDLSNVISKQGVISNNKYYLPVYIYSNVLCEYIKLSSYVPVEDFY